jgi:hypothetical protein
MVSTLRQALGLIALATIGGAVVGGVASDLVVRLVVHNQGPIFWEGGEGFLPLIAAVIAAFTGGLSVVACSLRVANRAPTIKAFVGFGVGICVNYAFGLWFVSHGAFTASRAQEGIAFWTCWSSQAGLPA